MKQLSSDDRFVAKKMAENDFYFFTRFMFQQRKGYRWIQALHHKIICDALMSVFAGQCSRLIINVPPRYSKTELVVINFIAWCLGRCPDSEFIHVSYSSQLATNNSWQTRELVQHEDYQRIFTDTKIRNDSAARHEWRTTHGGVVYASGAGGTITGYGAGKHRDGFSGAIIIDDPHKADEANSSIIRNSVIDWFQNTLESRQNNPGKTPIILIMQRLHEQDLSGWLLNGGNGEEWKHVWLPAIRDNGSPLWADKHSIEDLRRMEKSSPYHFAGQYMQMPAPLDGGIFKPHEIKILDATPADTIKCVRGWDLASTVNGDYTVGAKLCKCKDGRFVIADIVRDRLSPDKRDRLLLNTAILDGKKTRISIPQDPGQAGKTQVFYLTKQLAGYRVTSSLESGDKVTRAEPFVAQVNVGNVSMLRGEWNQCLINEMRMFPNGAHDDIVDALSRAFSELMVDTSTSVKPLKIF